MHSYNWYKCVPTFVKVVGLQPSDEGFGRGVLKDTGQVLSEGERGRVVIHVQYGQGDLGTTEQAPSVCSLGYQLIDRGPLPVKGTGSLQLT